MQLMQAAGSQPLTCNSCKRLVPSRLHELHESKFPFVSRIEFIRWKLSDFFLLMYSGSPIRRRPSAAPLRAASPSQRHLTLEAPRGTFSMGGSCLVSNSVFILWSVIITVRAWSLTGPPTMQFVDICVPAFMTHKGYIRKYAINLAIQIPCQLLLDILSAG